ncbi:MAG: LLM class flavin-dependent oxidoreductase [Euzebyales bacterium]|nr:LLM class flavin-dependent oxidoreductase [Euzebyales bacterium]
MQIGLGVFTGEALAAEGLTQTEVLAQSLEQARIAESAGLDAVWISEHHFLPNGYVGSVLPYAAALVTVTSTITVGVSVALAPLHDPVRLAEDAAFLDVLSGGRFALGLGLGYRDAEYAGFGTHRRERAGRMEELCDILRQAWGDGPLAHDGRYHKRCGVEVFPKPLRPGRVPLLMGGYAPQALDRVARRADAFIMDGGTDSAVFGSHGHNRDLFDRVEEAVRAYREALARHGRDADPLRFYLTLGGFLSADGADAAWEQLQEAYMYTRRVYGEWYGLNPAEYDGWYPQRMSPEEHARRRAEVWLGTPDDLVPRFCRLAEIVGDGLHVMFRCKYPGVPHEATTHSIRLLGEVRDRVAAAAPATGGRGSA